MSYEETRYKGNSLLNPEILEGRGDYEVDYLLDLDHLQKSFPFKNNGGLIVASVEVFEDGKKGAEIMAIKQGEHWMEAVGQMIVYFGQSFPKLMGYVCLALFKLLRIYDSKHLGMNKADFINSIINELIEIKDND